MRNAPTKPVWTWAWGLIAKINEQIGQSCRVYGRACAALVRLNADEATLNKFLVLSKDDVKASTAILNPNIPGSSSHQLSWIWQSRLGPVGMISDAMQECMFPLLAYLQSRQLIIVTLASSTGALASCSSPKNEMGRGTSAHLIFWARA